MLAMRHLAGGGGTIKQLNDLRGPMQAVLDHFLAQNDELARYKAQFGALPPSKEPPVVNDARSIKTTSSIHSQITELSDDEDEGSDTEQE